VVACSALKRAYRDRIRQCADGVRFVFLQGDFALIEARMSQRVGHYMRPGLLRSQFDTLEPPQADESDVLTLPITEPIDALVQQVLATLQQPSAPLTLQP
jgi:carbohydrate kinase (thermoresistant glucokinase family)